MRNLKALGLALVAIFALSAMTASAASADELKSSGQATLDLTSTGKTSFVTTAGSNTCTTEQYTSATSVTLPSSTVEVIPTYAGCTCIGVACVVHTNKCTYLLHMGTGTAGGRVDLQCPAGKDITLTAGDPAPLTTKCTIHIPPQTNLGTFTYKNIGAPEEVELTLNLSKIEYSHTTGSGLGKCTTGAGADGTLKGTVTVKGEKPGTNTQVGIFEG